MTSNVSYLLFLLYGMCRSGWCRPYPASSWQLSSSVAVSCLTASYTASTCPEHARANWRSRLVSGTQLNPITNKHSSGSFCCSREREHATVDWVSVVLVWCSYIYRCAEQQTQGKPNGKMRGWIWFHVCCLILNFDFVGLFINPYLGNYLVPYVCLCVSQVLEWKLCVWYFYSSSHHGKEL